jgi:hypothetical protein
MPLAFGAVRPGLPTGSPAGLYGSPSGKQSGGDLSLAALQGDRGPVMPPLFHDRGYSGGWHPT